MKAVIESSYRTKPFTFSGLLTESYILKEDIGIDPYITLQVSDSMFVNTPRMIKRIIKEMITL